MIRCKCCGKVIHGWYWTKFFCMGFKHNGLPVYVRKPVCNDCAETMVDERSTGGLLLRYEE